MRFLATRENNLFTCKQLRDDHKHTDEPDKDKWLDVTQETVQ